MASMLFGTSGIRDYVENLLPVSLDIGRAIGTSLPDGSRVCIATDTRPSKDELERSVISGLLSTGICVTRLGVLPTPVLSLMTNRLGFETGIMVTASHNPPEFNGLKLFNSDSIGYSRDQERWIEELYSNKDFRPGKGRCSSRNVEQEYFQILKGNVDGLRLDKNLKILVDPGNGAGAGFIARMYSELGLDVVSINDDPGEFSKNRESEPKEETLNETVEFARESGADLSLCYDGDADRVVFCDSEGFLGYNEMIAYISRLMVQKTGNKRIATTVETGRLLDLAVKDVGGSVFRGEVGDIKVAHSLKGADGCIGVEQVGVYIIPEIGYFPDTIFVPLFLISNIQHVREIRNFFERLPKMRFSKEKVSCPNHLREGAMRRIEEKVKTMQADDVNTVDGLRLEYRDSWILIRPSGTEPVIRVIVESESEARMKELMKEGCALAKESIAVEERVMAQT